MNRAIGTAVAASAVVVVALGATWYAGRPSADGDVFAPCRTTAVAGTPEIGGPFELVDTTGATVTDADVITEPAILYFGYTFCPDVCSFDAARNADAVDVLAERGISATPVFISIDPERDTPEVLKQYTEAMHEKMVGLTGTPEQVKAASDAYKTYYKKQRSDDEFYLVDHSVFTYLVLPEHGFVEFFRRDQTPEQLADVAQCFIEKA